MVARILNALALVLMVCNLNAQLSIIPEPAEIKIDNGSFKIEQSTMISFTDERAKNTIEYLQQYLKTNYDLELKDSQGGNSDGSIQIIIDSANAPKNGYTLVVNNKGVVIKAMSGQESFYAVQTLIQMLPFKKSLPLSVSYVKISDQPRFKYRGMHLDVSRHFFPIDYVKKYIDYLALHKMNFFHWHLTDDQGWRIEIKKYPELTKIGGYRNGTIVGHFPGTANDNKSYGGFYSQEEIREVVEYASTRYITVIPEIEMPGHSSAAIAAYNWLSCFPDEKTVIPHHPSIVAKQSKGKVVQETWGIFDDVLCAGKDSIFIFLEGVLDEVLELFPSAYIHIGGDESPKENWKRCEKCQQRIKDEHLKDEHALQSYFIQRIEKYLNSKGRMVIGWDEILEGGLAPNATVMSWRGEKGGIAAAKQQHDVIMTPGSHVYFDHSQIKNDDSLTFGGFTPFEKVYSYEPVPKVITGENEKFILGAQANVWTEYITNTSKLEYQVFPRISALSEVLWSGKESRNWNKFSKKMSAQQQRYKLWNINYCKKAIVVN